MEIKLLDLKYIISYIKKVKKRMYMFLFKIFICCSAIVGSVNSQTVELLNGFYQNSSKNDSIEVIKSDEEVIEIKFSDGSKINFGFNESIYKNCLLYTSPSPRDGLLSRMPSSA